MTNQKPAPTRDGFGTEIVELGKTDPRILVLSADLEDATRAEYFRDAHPGRFITTGIAEQDLVGTAAGLSLQGFIPDSRPCRCFPGDRDLPSCIHQE